jgi:hypothetical protein
MLFGKKVKSIEDAKKLVIEALRDRPVTFQEVTGPVSPLGKGNIYMVSVFSQGRKGSFRVYENGYVEGEIEG